MLNRLDGTVFTKIAFWFLRIGQCSGCTVVWAVNYYDGKLRLQLQLQRFVCNTPLSRPIKTQLTV